MELTVSDKTTKRIVIKIGSSSLTSLHGEVSRRKLERLTDEIAQLKDEGHEVILVSSGAVAAGYRKLGCLTRPDSLPEKQAAASIGQGLLMEAYSELFMSHGYVASQILITRSDFSDEKRYGNARNTLHVLMERGIIPIVNENDTVTIDRLRFGDNDTLSAKVAALVDADQLIILSDIDGLYTDNPTINPKATLVEKVTEITEEIEASAGTAGSSVGTGGMKSKIDAFKIAMASGIPSFLGKAGTPNILLDAVNGEAKGTYFDSEEEMINLNQKKRWIAFNSGPQGTVVVNETGEHTLKEKETPIYAKEIIHFEGRFKKGDVVRIFTPNQEEIGLGVIMIDSESLAGKDIAQEEPIMVRDELVCHQDMSVSITG